MAAEMRLRNTRRRSRSCDSRVRNAMVGSVFVAELGEVIVMLCRVGIKASRDVLAVKENKLSASTSPWHSPSTLLRAPTSEPG